MKKNNISHLINNYKIQRKKLDDKAPFKEVIKSLLGSLLINLIIYLIPGLIIYNLFIFSSILVVLKIFIIILVILFGYTYHYFYVYVMKEYQEKLTIKDFKLLILVDGSITSLILLIFTIVIMSLF